MVLYPGWGNPGCTYRLGPEGLESSPTERELAVLADVISHNWFFADIFPEGLRTKHPTKIIS